MRLENMLDINHELIKLSKHIDWESPDKEWGALFVSTKGAVGDAINVVMVAAGHNLRKILNKLRLLWLKIISGLMGSFIKPGQSAALNLA